MEEIYALLVQGGEVGAKGAEGIGAVLGSEAAGDFLFDLGHANGLFGEVVGKGDMMIGGEAPDIVWRNGAGGAGGLLPCFVVFARVSRIFGQADLTLLRRGCSHSQPGSVRCVERCREGRISLPSSRYFQRQSFEPLGLTSRYRPSPTAIL